MSWSLSDNQVQRKFQFITPLIRPLCCCLIFVAKQVPTSDNTVPQMKCHAQLEINRRACANPACPREGVTRCESIRDPGLLGIPHDASNEACWSHFSQSCSRDVNILFLYVLYAWIEKKNNNNKSEAYTAVISSISLYNSVACHEKHVDTQTHTHSNRQHNVFTETRTHTPATRSQGWEESRNGYGHPGHLVCKRL